MGWAQLVPGAQKRARSRDARRQWEDERRSEEWSVPGPRWNFARRMDYSRYLFIATCSVCRCLSLSFKKHNTSGAIK